MTIKVILKHGASFDVKCSDFSFKEEYGSITRYSFEGVTENNPVYLDLNQIAAFVRVMSDED